ncbi:MAG: isopentenyl-diphosphate delta-isomerase, partial [Acidimicrobiales bacterium]
MANRTQVVLVDETGRSVEARDKRAAHEAPGQLHRALSVFLFRPDDTMLVQQRAQSKYHFGGIWANACCSHPEP